MEFLDAIVETRRRDAGSSSTMTQVTNKSFRTDEGKQIITEKEDIICPKPIRPNQLPFDGFNQNSMYLGDNPSDILSLILGKEDKETDLGFYNGSPPVRTNNPLIRDALFEQAHQILVSSLSSSSSSSNASINSKFKPRIERKGSPSTCAVTSGMSNSPKIRVEGFALYVSTI